MPTIPYLWTAQPFLADLKHGVAVVAWVNNSTSLIKSGDFTATDELKTTLDEEQLFARSLTVEVAYHRPYMLSAEEEYRKSLNKHANVEFFSSVIGPKASTLALGAEYWTANMAGQVKFAGPLRLLCLETTKINSRERGTFRGKTIGPSTKANFTL